jgi:hypothetical protein
MSQPRYTSAQLADLRSAMAEGAREIRANGRVVIFRDLDEMLELERRMSAELEGTTRKPARVYGVFRRA